MDKKSAVKDFLEVNNLNKDMLSNPDDPANFDPNIKDINEKVDLWLNTFEKEDQETFLKLLSRYTYLSYGNFIKRLSALSDMIIKKYNISESEALFVTVEGESGVKCGGDEIASGICRANNSFDKYQVIRTVSRAGNALVSNAKIIVFIDDIVATGFSTYKCIKNFLERFGEYIPGGAKMILAPLAISSRGKRFIKRKSRENNFEIHIEDMFPLKSAFKKNYIFRSEETKAKEEIVRKYERIIDEFEADDEKSFFLGFKECKLLFSTYYDTANNTLCTFWKPTDTHIPLFKRSGQSRISLSDLKNRKKACANTAYEDAKFKKR